MSADPRRVKELFAAALDLPDAPARRALLDRECASDPELRRRLDALLAAHDHPESALERPLAVPAPTGPFAPSAEADDRATGATAGQIVAGRYKLLERIGEGGMGEVWVADQLEPVKRRVALKLIKPGMDSRSVLARFEAERQALALMDHPNIAKVLDAGSTETGVPFFAMELVKGTPITEFCDARKLSPKERLELFIPVCRAIQHAHQKGVIHRDIKPSNVLVALHDEVAVPKVIDFGVAKAVGQQLTEKTLYTGFGSLVGTPAYMAPEQATFNQLDVDTRADVYALGVLLYELLAGSPPFDPERLKKAALDEVLRLVREEEPQRPSARLSTSQAKATIASTRQSDPEKLAKLVRGELDWIVMRAIEKDRNRRYDTPAGLAKDVERYLAGDAVEACPPTLGYRLRKAYRKNRAAVRIGLAFVGVVVGAAVTGALLAVQARRAEATAEDRRQEAEDNRDRALHNFTLFEGALRAAREHKAEAEKERDETKSTLKKLTLAQKQQADDQYVWDMQLLPLAFEANNIAEVSRVLDRYVPQPGQTDRRGFEWFYWDRQLHTDLRTDRLPDAAESRGIGTWVASPDGSRVARFTTPVGGNGDPEEPPTLIVWDVATRKVVLKHRMPIEKPVNQTYTSPMSKHPLFSADGRRVAVEWGFTSPVAALGSGRHLRQVLDVASGKVLLNQEGDQVQVVASVTRWGGAFSPDGRRFAEVSRDLPKKKEGPPVPVGRIRVWDLDSGKEACPPLDANILASSPFSSDGSLLLTQSRQAVQSTRVVVWDLASGRERSGWDVRNATVSSLALSQDGTRVAGATSISIRALLQGDDQPTDPQVKIWDVTGKELHTIMPPGLDARTGSLRVFFSPDGSRLAIECPARVGSRGSATADLTVWNTATGKLLPSPAGFQAGWGPESEAVFSPDGKQIITASGNVLRTWEVETGRPVLTFRGHVNPIAARGYTADGKRLWSVEHDGLLKEWDTRPGHVEIRFVAPIAPAGVGRNSSSATVIAVSPDGSRVASLIEVRTDPKPTAPGAAAVRVWDANGKSVAVLQLSPREPDPQRRPVYALDLSRDGRRAVLTRSESGTVVVPGKEAQEAQTPDITVWDVESKAVLLHRRLEPGQAPNVAISPDGKTVAVASGMGTRTRPRIHLFDIDGKRERTPLTAGEVMGVFSLTFSPDGRRLAALCVSLDAAVRKTSARIAVWDVESNSQLCSVEVLGERPALAGITSVVRIAWAPDGSRFVHSPEMSTSTELAVYDTTGKKVLTLDQPATVGLGEYGAQYLAYSPDGKRIAALQPARTAGKVPALKVWDATSGKELLSLRPTTFGEAVRGKTLTFTADGHRLQFTEHGSDRRLSEPGGGESGVQSLVLTPFDATPVPAREPKKP